MDPDLDIWPHFYEMDHALVKFPDFPFPAHHLLLKAALQRLRLDHAKLLAAQPVFSISKTRSCSSTCFSSDFYMHYLRNTMGESSAEPP